MLIEFLPEFVLPIVTGIKIHTIRKDEIERWKLNSTMEMSVLNEVGGLEVFFRRNLVSKQRIKFFGLHNGYESITIIIDGKELDVIGFSILVANSGFNSHVAFFDFFIPLAVNGCYFGWLLHWTDKKY